MPAGSRLTRGLSPRVRGNPGERIMGYVFIGSIPACAGEPVADGLMGDVEEVYPRVCGGTLPSAPARRTNAVYPRVCGRTGWTLRRPRYIPGLSPRVRGNLRPGSQADQQRRSIPACAGEPIILSPVGRRWRVYPRVCGGTSALEMSRLYSCGLSPRVRGNPSSIASSRTLPGSIPACAGEPSQYPHRRYAGEVYPRVCGGTVVVRQSRVSEGGLSPRVRGNHYCRKPQRAAARSIPACAGEPVAGDVSGAGSRVYPRVCGGTSLTRSPAVAAQGLSPRVRGNRIHGRRKRSCWRSIPACAGEPAAGSRTAHSGGGLSPRVRGNPRHPYRSPGHAGVYPRVCGGTLACGRDASHCRGLSPRVRGNPGR